MYGDQRHLHVLTHPFPTRRSSHHLTLPDSTQVFPAHGAGSACGKNLSTELSSTMGAQRSENYALRAPDRQTFIDLVTEGQVPAPGYFLHDATMNKKQRALMEETTAPRSMSWEEVQSALDRKSTRLKSSH